MVNNSELECLLGAMRTSQVTSLEVKDKDQRLRVVLPVPVLQTTQNASSNPQTEAPDVRQVSAISPTIGTFLRRGIDDGLALLETGMQVTTGEVLGYVCHGPVRVIVEAPRGGVLSDYGPDDGAVFGLGDTVFILETTS